jgi:hypothetical protein
MKIALAITMEFIAETDLSKKQQEALRREVKEIVNDSLGAVEAEVGGASFVADLRPTKTKVVLVE